MNSETTRPQHNIIDIEESNIPQENEYIAKSNWSSKDKPNEPPDRYCHCCDDDDDIVEQIPGGAVRENSHKPSYSSIPPMPMRRFANVWLEGKIHYGMHNWRKGMPYSVVIDHFMEHWNKWLEGDTSEDHLPKIAWAMFVLMWYEKHRPELDDVRCLDLEKMILDKRRIDSES